MNVHPCPGAEATPIEPPIPEMLRDLTSVAVALVDRSGMLIDANRAFAALVPDAASAPAPCDVRARFVNPRFDRLAARRAGGSDAVVYRGPMSLGETDRGPTTLTGMVFAHGPNLLVVAERDVEDLERLASLTLKLNDELAEHRREISRLGREIEHRAADAARAMHDRETLIRAIEDEGAATRAPEAEGGRRAGRPETPRRALSWTDDLTTGIASLDDEHRGMIDHYNAMIQAIDSQQDVATVRHQFQALMHYTRRHFEHEERVMRNIGYPGASAHKSEHERLLQDAEDFVRSMGHALRRDDCPAIARYFEYWLLRHTRQQDAKLRKFVERVRP